MVSFLVVSFFAVVSTLVITVESFFTVESTLTIVVSLPSFFALQLNAAAETTITKAKTANLNEFLMFVKFKR